MFKTESPRRGERVLSKTIKVRNGYTIVELVVVMAIIAILLPLAWSGYNATRKQNYTKHVASVAQTSIRDTFIDIISTKTQNTAPCNGKSPQVQAVKVKLGASSEPVSKLYFCKTTNLLDSTVEEIIDPSSSLNYKQSVEVSSKILSTGTQISGSNDYLFFIFTSPYGKYYNFSLLGYSGDPNLSLLSDFQHNWETDSNMIWMPKSGVTRNMGDIEIYFDSDTSANQGIVEKITISKEGNVSLD